MGWNNTAVLGSKKYVCGHCDSSLATQTGYHGRINGVDAHIYICHHCEKPTFFDWDGAQIPGSSYGDNVKHIPSHEVEAIYKESRDCIKVNAYTASILCSRKLLMNIAVSKSAAEDLSFVQYVEFISSKGLVPPEGKEWVDHIREKGNEATHQIAIKTREEAEQLITFTGMLLKFIYEFPATLKKTKSK